MKNVKALGVDEIIIEQIKVFSTKSKQWLQTFSMTLIRIQWLSLISKM